MIHNNFTPKGRIVPTYPGAIVANHSYQVTAEWAYGVKRGSSRGFISRCLHPIRKPRIDDQRLQDSRASEHLEKIFLPFYRIPTIDGEPTHGAGLGLAITERIVRMYGGSVNATNALDGGLIVNLELSLLE